MLFDCASRDEKLCAVRCLIEDVSDFKEQEDYLGFIGAGPLEDLMSGWLLDQIEGEVSDPRFLTALLNVRMSTASPELQQRVRPNGVVVPMEAAL